MHGEEQRENPLDRKWEFELHSHMGVHLHLPENKVHKVRHIVGR